MGVYYENYDVLDTIGVGTVGTIFRVRDKKSGDVYALKLLSPAVSNDELIVARFHREILVLSKLDHPNIVRYCGQGKHDGQIFYLMEYIRGGTIKKLLSTQGSLGWLEVAECGRQLASALQHAHNHGVIHRDIKPGNVFLTLEGQAKLGDFGIARDLKSKDITDAGLTVGTYAYMAPELIRGERAITGEVDLYAFGCLLFEMLTGKTPFTGENFAQIFDQHLNKTPSRVRDLCSDCPQVLDDIIFQLLQKDPEKRPFNARTVQGVLDDISTGSTVEDTFHPKRDRAAGSVRPGQVLLRHRVLSTSAMPEISWRKIGVLCAVIASLIAGALLLTR